MLNLVQGIREGVTVYSRVIYHLIGSPFRLTYNLLAFPFRKLRRFRDFLNEEPVERPVVDVLADIVSNEKARALFWEHVRALRGHLMRSVGVLALTVIASFWAAEDIMAYLAQPIGGLEKLQAIQVTEEIGVFMRVAMAAGIALAFPYIAFEIWWFAAAGGLKSREKKIGLAGIPLAAILFLTGMAFTFYVLLPAALPFLGGFTPISESWAAGEYFGFVTGLMFWIGVFFEFPLVVYVLSVMGLIHPDALRGQWRLAVVIIALLAAAVTPTVDPINMTLVMIPMILLYFISIGLSYLAYAGRKRQTEAGSDPDDEGGAG
jgi:sec-independent protein translocase protein TatC